MHGSRELHLIINPADGGKPLDLLAATVRTYAGADVSTADGGAIYRAGYLDQDGYRVSFNGFGLARGDEVAQVTQDASTTTAPATEKPMSLRETQAAAAASWTPAPPKPTITSASPGTEALNLSGGKPIQYESTVRFEDLQSHQTQYLFLVFLADGELKGELVQ
jgi:hypothetical protein